MSSTIFQICIAGIKRTTSNQEFSPKDYEICITRESQIGTWSLPLFTLTANYDPSEMARNYLSQIAGIDCGQIFSIDVNSEVKDPTHYVTLCYVATVPHESEPQTRPSIEVKFETLSNTIDMCNDASIFNQSHTQILRAIISWLNDQHSDKFIRIDKLFKGGSEAFSMPISIKALLDNPLSQRNLAPEEDKLLVALDNPIFQFLIGEQLTT